MPISSTSFRPRIGTEYAFSSKNIFSVSAKWHTNPYNANKAICKEVATSCPPITPLLWPFLSPLCPFLLPPLLKGPSAGTWTWQVNFHHRILLLALPSACKCSSSRSPNCSLHYLLRNLSNVTFPVRPSTSHFILKMEPKKLPIISLLCFLFVCLIAFILSNMFN